MNNLFRAFLLILSFIGLSVLLFRELPNGQIVLTLLPLSFFMIACICKRLFDFARYGVCIKIQLIIQFISYVVLPVLLSFTGIINIVGVNPSESSIPLGVTIMVYSLILTSLVASFVIKRRSKIMSLILNNFSINKKIHIVQKVVPLYEIDNFKLSSFLVIILYVIAIILMINGKSELVDYRFFWNIPKRYSSEGKDYLVTFLPRFSAIMVHYGTTMIVINKTRRNFNKSILTRIFVYLVCLLSIVVVRGDNRLLMLANGLAIYFTLITLYPKKKTFFVSVFLTLVMVISVQTTIIKTFRGNINTMGSGISVLSIIVKWLQLYVPSPRVVAISVEMRQQINVNPVLTFIKDIITSVNVIGYLGSQMTTEMTNTIFNNYVSNNRAIGDAYGQIMIMLAQGYFTFGFILSPLYNILSTILCIRCDELIIANRQKQTADLYPIIFTGCITGVASCLSTSGYLQTITWASIPLILFIRINLVNLFNRYRSKI